MELDFILAILIVGGGLVIGLLVGWILGYLLSPKGKANRKVSSSPGEVLRVLRQPTSGKLSILMDGKSFLNPKELNVNRRYRLVMTLEEMRRWLGEPSVQEDSFDRRLKEVSEVKPTQVQEAFPPPPTPTSPSSQSPAMPIQTAGLEGAIQKPKANLNPLFLLTQAITADIPKQVSQEKSIAVQIDELLQTKLIDSPLKDRGIRLMELPGKGLVVMVGLEQYESVEDVPDEQIKALIKQCVTEWEDSLYPE